MDNHKKSIAALMVVVSFLTFLSGCGDDPKPKTQAQKVTQMLTSNGGKWSPAGSGAVTIDGTDVTTDLFSGFTITFSGNTFTTTGTTPVWLRQDTWSFKDESATVLIRGQDGKEVTIGTISKTDLTLTLTWDENTYEGGRSKSMAGTHTFVLKK